ncbi:glycosyltransferase family 4 protein [Myxococcota bacterium]|nr:glycosyltransferase family 4 protein [Myxococcota bacterium]
MLLAHTWGYRRGGDSTHVDALEGALARRGHRVVRFAMAHPRNRPDPHEADFAAPLDWGALDAARRGAGRLAGTARALYALPRGIWNRDAARRLAGLIDRERPDVVHAHHLHHHLTPSVLATARSRGVRTLWTLHDYEVVCPNGLLYTRGEPCEACRPARYHHAVLNACKRGSRAASAAAAAEASAHRLLGVHRLADGLICPSSFLLERLRDFGVGGVPLHHLPHFVPPDWLSPAPPPGVEAPFLFAGRLAAEKGVDLLVDAAVLAPSLRFDVAGDGPDGERLRALVLRRGVPGRVRFLGSLSAEGVRAALDRCLAAVVPSRWPENLPFSVLEPMARGRAVVAAAVGGIPEQVRPGETGLLFRRADARALADACLALAGDPAAAQAMGREAARDVAARFGEEGFMVRLMALYAGRGGGRGGRRAAGEAR